MKSVFLLLSGLLLMGLGCPALAQDFTNTGAAITVQPGATVYVGTGGLRNQAGGTITNAGTLRVDGLLTNAGTLDLSTGTLEVRADVTNSGTVTPGTGTVIFSGTADQLLTPSGATLYQVLVSKPAATTLRLAGDLTITHLLQLTGGYVNTRAPGGTVYTLRLTDGASLSGEASGRYVRGALQVTRNAVSGAAVDFGLGAVLDPDGNNLGTVSITRTAGLQLADVSYGQNLGISPKGIDRIWTVTPTTQPTTPVDLTLSWLPDDDNGLVGFSKVQLWQQPTIGQPWTPVGPLANASIRIFSSSPTVLNRFTVSNNSSVVPGVNLVSLTPNSGLAGSTFAIAGTNLSGATTVTFTPISGPATAVTSGFVVASSTSITGVSVPAGLAAGVYTVTVTTAAGVSNGLPFTVTSSASTATPVVTAPTPNQVLVTTMPTYAGTAPAGSTVMVYVDGTSIGTTTALGTGNFSLAQPTALAQGLHQVYATAQLSGQPVSAGSAPIAFTVDTVAPVATLSSSAGTSGNSTSTTPLPFSVTFSEPVTGFSAAGISVTNGTLTSNPTGSGAGPYTFSVTPTTPGIATTVTITANAAQDAAGNGNAASSTYSLTYVVGPSVATTWTGTISTDWFTAGNWNSGVPTTTSDASIPGSTPFSPVLNAGAATTRALTIGAGASLTQVGGTLDVRGNLTNNGTFSPLGGTVVLGTAAGPTILGSGPVRFWDLTIDANGAQLGTSAGASVRHVLTLTGNFTTQGNRFTIESASTGDALVVNSGGTVVGAATVQRYIDPSANPSLGYHHYTAPVSNSTVADLMTAGFTPVINPSYNTSATPLLTVPFPTVYGYDESRTLLTNNLNNFDKGYFSPTALSDPLAVGRGYTVNIAANQLVDFVGTLNNDVIPMALANNRAGNADAGWHLVGNPYPSPLNYSLVAAADKVNLEGAIYVYSSTSQYGGNYRVYLNGLGNPVIPMGQAFFVRVAGTSAGALTFRNSQRLTVPNVTTFQRTAEVRPLVQLTLQAAGSSGLLDDLYVYAQAGATAGFDMDFDAEKLANPTGLNLSALAASKQLAIDGLPELSTSPRVVPLAVGVPTPGSYTLTAPQLLNLTNVPVYLLDLQTGALIDLAQQPTYSFTVSNSSTLITGRFELVFSPQPLATVPAGLAQQVALYPNPATTSAWLELPAGLSRQPVTATLIDAVGRAVRTQVLPAGQASHALQLTGLATGVYALRLSTEVGTVVKKLVIE